MRSVTPKIRSERILNTNAEPASDWRWFCCGKWIDATEDCPNRRCRMKAPKGRPPLYTDQGWPTIEEERGL